MRVTRVKLIELARKEVEHRAAQDGGLLSGYLIGSVASGEPLLGDAADIDLVLVHDGEPIAPREVVPLTDQVHFDIQHHPRRVYAQPPLLRVHPWLGPALCAPIFLYDPTHFFERAQAGARGQFHRPDYVRARAIAFLDQARRMNPGRFRTEEWIEGYLAAALDGANAAGTLAGFPAAGRRVALGLQSRAQELGYPEVYGGFLRLLGADELQSDEVEAWILALERVYDRVSPGQTDPLLSPARRAYYLGGLRALVEADQPEAAVWPLLDLWVRCSHGQDDVGLREDGAEWNAARARLGLAPRDAPRRAEHLETYLDHVEAIIEEWADRHGA